MAGITTRRLRARSFFISVRAARFLQFSSCGADPQQVATIRSPSVNGEWNSVRTVLSAVKSRGAQNYRIRRRFITVAVTRIARESRELGQLVIAPRLVAREPVILHRAISRKFLVAVAVARAKSGQCERERGYNSIVSDATLRLECSAGYTSLPYAYACLLGWPDDPKIVFVHGGRVQGEG